MPAPGARLADRHQAATGDGTTAAAVDAAADDQLTKLCRRLLRRTDANRNQRRIGRARIGAAGSPSFAQELRLIAGRSAIGRYQNFVVLALHRAPGYAIRLDDPHARAWRPRRALRSCGTGRARRTFRSRWTDITLRALRPCGTGVPLRALAATGQRTGQARQQRHRKCQMRSTHFQSLPSFFEILEDCRSRASAIEDQT